MAPPPARPDASRRDDQGRLTRLVASVGVYTQRRIIALFFLGFSSGLPLALTFSTLSVWLTESGISRTAIGLFAAVGTPYALKFLWAPVIDRAPMPVLGRLLGHRRGWMVATQLALIASLLALGASDPAADPWRMALLALVVAFCSASQDIVIDAYRVELLEERQQGAGAAMAVFGYRIGMLISGAGALYLAEVVSWFLVYAAMAAMVLVGLVTILLNPEPGVTRGDAAARAGKAEAYLRRHGLGRALADVGAWLHGAVVAPFAEFTTRSGWMAILLFVMLYKFGDSLAGVMINPFLIDIGFSKADIANVSKLFGFGATLGGLWVGGALLNGVGMVRSLWICGVLQLASNFMFAVQAMVGADIGLLALTVGLENLASGMGTAVFVAYLSSLCNVSYTATQYALLSSFMAAARTWLSSSGGWMADQMGWATFFSGTALAAVPGLLLLLVVARVAPPPERVRVPEVAE